MRRRIHLLAMLVLCGGAAALAGPSPANALYLGDVDTPKRYCCYHQFSGEGCCGDNGCRITSRTCERW